MPRWMIIALATLLPASALGDTVVLRNGKKIQGTVTERSAFELTIEVRDRGVLSQARIPQDQIVSVVYGPQEAASQASDPVKTAKAATSTAPATRPAAQVARTPAFFQSLALTAVGQGRDSPKSLTLDQQRVWKAILEAEGAGRLDQQLLAMKTAADVFAGEPTRLDALAEKEKRKRFAFWMAEIRWQLISPRYKDGRFDLADITPVEKEDVVGILRGQTEAAIEPLRAYFPQPPKRGERPANPLLGINASNAIALKDKALFAQAVLLAQLKLEPEMPTQDRLQLTTNLANVQRALRRATDYEGQAKAALERAEREKRLAEERAARAARLNSASPRP